MILLWTLWMNGFEPCHAAAGNAPDSKTCLVIGKVSENPKKHYWYLKPMADYAVKQMGDLGITKAKVLMARDNEQMIQYLREGRVDWVTETVFSAILYQQQADADFLVKKWKKGVSEYHTVFFTRKDSPIQKLSDLRGRKIAFEDAGSTSAFFYPFSAFIREKIPMVKLASPSENPPENAVGYLFVRQEINISTWVYRNLVDAGCFNNLDWEKDDHVRAAFREEMRIFHQMEPISRALEVVGSQMAPEIKDRLKKILLNAHKDPKAARILRDYQGTARFEELSDKDQAELKEITLLLNTIQSNLQ